MAEVLVRYTALLEKDGVAYTPQACGRIGDDGLWEGWIEFVPDAGEPVRSPRETEQPNRDALLYWAQGLTVAYLEGALDRALLPRATVPVHDKPEASLFEEPAPGVPVRTATARPVLDPFATYIEGEELLRDQLIALSRDHLVAIVRGYRLDVPRPEDLAHDRLVRDIVDTVRREAAR